MTNFYISSLENALEAFEKGIKFDENILKYQLWLAIESIILLKSNNEKEDIPKEKKFDLNNQLFPEVDEIEKELISRKRINDFLYNQPIKNEHIKVYTELLDFEPDDFADSPAKYLKKYEETIINNGFFFYFEMVQIAAYSLVVHIKSDEFKQQFSSLKLLEKVKYYCSLKKILLKTIAGRAYFQTKECIEFFNENISTLIDAANNNEELLNDDIKGLTIDDTLEFIENILEFGATISMSMAKLEIKKINIDYNKYINYIVNKKETLSKIGIDKLVLFEDSPAVRFVINSGKFDELHEKANRLMGESSLLNDESKNYFKYEERIQKILIFVALIDVSYKYNNIINDTTGNDKIQLYNDYVKATFDLFEYATDSLAKTRWLKGIAGAGTFIFDVWAMIDFFIEGCTSYKEDDFKKGTAHFSFALGSMSVVASSMLKYLISKRIIITPIPYIFTALGFIYILCVFAGVVILMVFDKEICKKYLKYCFWGKGYEELLTIKEDEDFNEKVLNPEEETFKFFETDISEGKTKVSSGRKPDLLFQIVRLKGFLTPFALTEVKKEKKGSDFSIAFKLIFPNIKPNNYIYVSFIVYGYKNSELYQVYCSESLEICAPVLTSFDPQGKFESFFKINSMYSVSADGSCSVQFVRHPTDIIDINNDNEDGGTGDTDDGGVTDDPKEEWFEYIYAYWLNCEFKIVGISSDTYDLVSHVEVQINTSKFVEISNGKYDQNSAIKIIKINS